MTLRCARRDFLRCSSMAAAAMVLPRALFAQQGQQLFRISLAQWSLHKAFFGQGGVQKRDPMDFAKISKDEFQIDAIEYVNQFYKDKKDDDSTLRDLKKRAEDAGVKSVLIMCDGEGALGDADEKKRQQAVRNHFRWVEWAQVLGCHSIRVNAAS